MGRVYPEFIGGPRGVALLFLRLVVGTAFVIHGYPKIQHPMSWMPPEAPVPGWLQLLAAVSEFGGGIAWVLGALTPLFSLGLLCTMAFAVLMVHVRMGHSFVDTSAAHDQPSFELPLTYLAVALILLLVGPGRFSVDAALFGRPRKPEPSAEPVA